MENSRMVVGFKKIKFKAFIFLSIVAHIGLVYYTSLVFK